MKPIEPIGPRPVQRVEPQPRTGRREERDQRERRGSRKGDRRGQASPPPHVQVPAEGGHLDVLA